MLRIYFSDPDVDKKYINKWLIELEKITNINYIDKLDKIITSIK